MLYFKCMLQFFVSCVWQGSINSTYETNSHNFNFYWRNLFIYAFIPSYHCVLRMLAKKWTLKNVSTHPFCFTWILLTQSLFWKPSTSTIFYHYLSNSVGVRNLKINFINTFVKLGLSHTLDYAFLCRWKTHKWC